MAYACSSWEFGAYTHVLKMQRLQNRVLQNTDKVPRNAPIHYAHMTLQIPYVYDCKANYDGSKH
jgi:hypothetical protein